MSLGGSGLRPLINEFLRNVVGMGLKEVFATEFETFMGQFSPSRPARQKMEKKNRAMTRARV